MAHKELLSDIAGMIAKILAQPGQPVEEGMALIVLEAMKMEIPVESPVAGTLLAIHVAEGDMVEEGQRLATIER